MPRLIDELAITYFGTSAKYLSVLEQKNIYPKAAENGLSLKSLKAIYSTGSPLPPSTFHYIYRAFGPINLGSITGGYVDFPSPKPSLFNSSQNTHHNIKHISKTIYRSPSKTSRLNHHPRKTT